MELTEHWPGLKGKERLDDLVDIVPQGYSSLLDVGAGSGYVAGLMTPFFERVTALDLEEPDIADEGIVAVKGDVTQLDFPDDSFDVVLCTEVLEHIPPESLQKACNEICRTARHCVVVGVPHNQDTRVGRTTCRSCGKKNPPWGHVNIFNEELLRRLFHVLRPARISFAGETRTRTNVLSAFLMNVAGNPCGIYGGDQRCLHCGSKLVRPPGPSFFQRICYRLAVCLNAIQECFARARPAWIHMVFTKTDSGCA
jgi:SAM-dependent methyltransferase